MISDLLQVGDVLMLKSGSEFREFSLVTVTFPESDCRPMLEVVRQVVTKDTPPDKDMSDIVDKYLNKVGFFLMCGPLRSCCLYVCR